MAEEEEKREGKGFTVQDRRRFSPDTGEARENTVAAAAGTADETKEGGSDSQSGERSRQDLLPEINFSTFVIGLSTQALMQLGEIASPLSGKVETDIAAAKQMVDILGMLQEKTKGNLNSSEERLLEDILFDLRMRYVEAVKKSRSD